MKPAESLATYIAERIALPVVLAFAAGVLVSNLLHERRAAQAQIHAAAPACERAAEECRP